MQTNKNADRIALSMMQLISDSGADERTSLEAVVAMSASSVIGGACDREQLFSMINDYLSKTEGN